ncbi:CCC motif membrane protein [Muriicola sp.]|uniref:CCC motif membrane protein n=2 Tax=Muriicola sp. TaxID=2020856 RepID=UPI003C742CBF
MEQQKLPNVTIAIVLAILSYVCCCMSGIPAVIMSGIGLFLVKKDEKTFMENPELYSNHSQLKTAKILTIIGLVLGILYLCYTIYAIQSMGGWDAYMEKTQEIMEQFGVEE